MADYIHGHTATLSITDGQMASLLTLFAPLIDSFVERVAQRVKQMADEQTPKYYTRQQVADLLSVSLPTVHAMANRGDLHPLKPNGGRHTLFDAHAVDEAIRGGSLRKYKKGGAQ